MEVVWYLKRIQNAGKLNKKKLESFMQNFYGLEHKVEGKMYLFLWAWSGWWVWNKRDQYTTRKRRWREKNGRIFCVSAMNTIWTTIVLARPVSGRRQFSGSFLQVAWRDWFAASWRGESRWRAAPSCLRNQKKNSKVRNQEMRQVFRKCVVVTTVEVDTTTFWPFLCK